MAVDDLRSGLAEAAAYLKRAARGTDKAESGGFYLPPTAFEDARFAGAPVRMAISPAS